MKKDKQLKSGNKGLNKKKSWIKKMAEFTNVNNINMLGILIAGYVVYGMINKGLVCFTSLGCFLTISNIIYLVFFVFFIFMGIKLIKIISKNDELSNEINKLTKEKLELEIKKLKQ